MAFKFKPKEWLNLPSKATKINAAALEDLEERTAGYVDTEKGQPEGVGTLDATGHQPLSESPLSVASGSAKGATAVQPGQLELNIRSFPELDSTGATDMASVINAAITQAAEKAVSAGVPTVRLIFPGSGVYKINSSIQHKSRVILELDESLIFAGATFPTAGMIRAKEEQFPEASAGTGTTISGSSVLTGVSSPGSFSYGNTITGAGIPANTKVLVVDITTSRIVMDTPATASATVALTRAATYYGRYLNCGIVGGTLDPNGFDTKAVVRMLFTNGLRIEGLSVLHHLPAEHKNWAFQIGGRNGSVKDSQVLSGESLFEDGIHVMHGTDWLIADNYIESGDDAIALGSELGDVFETEPDALRSVNIVGNEVRSLRGFAFKAYVRNGKTGRDWEISDINVSDLTGRSGVLRNGGIWIEDLNGGLAGTTQIKAINIDDVALTLGSAGHDDTQGRALQVFSASNVSVSNYTADITQKEEAAAGFDFAWINNSEIIRLDELRCPKVVRRNFLHIVNTNDARLARSRTAGSTALTAVRVQSSELSLIDNRFSGVLTGQAAVRCTEGAASTLEIRGNWARRAGETPTGYGLELLESALQSLVMVDNDWSTLSSNQGGINSAAELRKVPYFQVRGNRNQPDVEMTSAPYQRILVVHCRFDSVTASATPTVIDEATIKGIPSGSNGAFGVVYINPADWARTGQEAKLKMRLLVDTNATAPGGNFTAKLYPVTGSAGGAAAATPITVGAAVTGSTVVAAPGASALTSVETEDFVAPAAGYYCIMVTLGADMGANSSALVRVALEARAV